MCISFRKKAAPNAGEQTYAPRQVDSDASSFRKRLYKPPAHIVRETQRMDREYQMRQRGIYGSQWRGTPRYQRSGGASGGGGFWISGIYFDGGTVGGSDCGGGGGGDGGGGGGDGGGGGGGGDGGGC